MENPKTESDDPGANLKAVSVALLIIIVACTLALSIAYLIEQ